LERMAPSNEKDGRPMPSTTNQLSRQTPTGAIADLRNERSVVSMAQQQMPLQRTLTLWVEVAAGIDKSSTVVWKNAVDSLSESSAYLLVSQEARVFAEKYMKPVISILLEQQPHKIGQMERNCVEESLKLAVTIVNDDLKTKVQVSSGECIVLEVLGMVFNRKKMFYKGPKQNWNTNMTGLPEVRIQMINKFRLIGGFGVLGQYLSSRTSSSIFPSLEILHHVLLAIGQTVVPVINSNDIEAKRAWEDDLLSVARAVMEYMGNATEDVLKKLSHEDLTHVRFDLQQFFDRLDSTRLKETQAFYNFYRQFALKLITSQSLPLRLYGWDTVTELIEASTDLRPPPKSFLVSGAGTTFVNGTYKFASPASNDGFVRPGTDVRYEHSIPSEDSEGKEKKITLFRCTMRSQQKWWFLSEADEDQPGTDKDIDYYQHKSKKHEESEPPVSGWVTCKNSGIDPPPILEARGLMVPPGEEYNTMEHQLAKWAISNGIIELVLGSSIHREVVARSIPLIRFLAFMCKKDDTTALHEDPNTVGPNAYCLQVSHLTLAWKTCTSKLDSAVSAEVYQLLVSILPSLPNELAIKLLTSIQSSLHESEDKHDYLFEVAEFCSALADMNPNDMEGGGNVNNSHNPVHGGVSDEVRVEILKLLWAVLTHPGASSLKSYEILKTSVTNELRVEPMGTLQRHTFLESCKQALCSNASATCVDEYLSLRMMNLTKFVLGACPRDQAVRMIVADNAQLAQLVFQDLTAYLNRRAAPQQLTRKLSSTNSAEVNHSIALVERFRILRYVYGLSVKVNLSKQQLDVLWNLCVTPEDREELMVFLADASNNEAGSVAAAQMNNTTSRQIGPLNKQYLTTSYSEEVHDYAFQNLFCSDSVDWEQLGPRAYQSFQILFKSLRKSMRTPLTSNKAAIDALWRICLAAGHDDVASQAMRDLLFAYSSISSMKQENIAQNAWTQNVATDESLAETEQSFAKRIFQCLKKVQEDLEADIVTSGRSAERCVRILNAAVDHSVGVEKGTSLAVSSISLVRSIEELVQYVPHGMRGQVCYITISVLAKRTPGQTRAVNSHSKDSNGMPIVSSSPIHNTVTRLPHTERFSLQVHPLEQFSSVKRKVSLHCRHPIDAVKPISSNNRQRNLNIEPETSIVGDLGIYEGCEVVFLLANVSSESKTFQNGRNTEKKIGIALEEIFGEGAIGPSDGFFNTLLSVLETLPVSGQESGLHSNQFFDTQKLVWNLLLSVPSNACVVERVRFTAQRPLSRFSVEGDSKRKNLVEMSVDIQRKDKEWNKLLDCDNFQRSVYVMQVVDSFLQPANEILQHVNGNIEEKIMDDMERDKISFRHGFIESGGFDAVLRFFTRACNQNETNYRKFRMGSACALRILKCCFFGSTSAMSFTNDKSIILPSLDKDGILLMNSLQQADTLLLSLTSTVVCDAGVSDDAILDVLLLLQSLLFPDKERTKLFASLPDKMAQKLTMTLLLWESRGAMSAATVGTGCRIRKTTEELILLTPTLAQHTLPWLIESLNLVDATSDSSEEFFSVLIRLIEDTNTLEGISMPSASNLKNLGTEVCKKLSSHPPPNNDTLSIDFSTGVLCGCLKLLKSLIQNGGVTHLSDGVVLLLKANDKKPWSEMDISSKTSGWFRSKLSSLKRDNDDLTMINLIGVLFDGFLLDGSSPSLSAICCDQKSRKLGFDAITACTVACKGGKGYIVLASRIDEIVASSSPSLRHRWGQYICNEERGTGRTSAVSSKYSGLRNQGCTCYMNSVLQQLFMMPELRKNIYFATLPSTLRSSGAGCMAKGTDLISKKISVQWDSGVSYEATVENYNEDTGMHTIRYLPLQISSINNAYGSGGNGIGHQAAIRPDDVAGLPEEMLDEFVLSEGRPGKETGTFEVIVKSSNSAIESKETSGQNQDSVGENSSEKTISTNKNALGIKETDDEVAYRRLLQEVQRTFVHLDEGARGRVFDPRSLVEASGCLKLEFDVWQQNDASEFAMKLLDRLEVPLKRWSVTQFKYLEHTFRLKQTKQKICKVCGLKTNREENLMNIDCQIRGKSDIHEALSTMCEVEYMEGDNKVFCDRCKKNCDTVLRTAISALPDMLILSLKRFDLDYNTFETVKLNSRLAFSQTLNMKRYTLEGVEAMEKKSSEEDSASPMDTNEEEFDPLSSLPDEDYEYRLAGVLVHHGVAQGGHYYSFIRDRLAGANDSSNKWYRFDDEDVTPFDPSLIEVECFGGKVKKETKWSNGQVNTVETEQLANALMLFYEKVKPAKFNSQDSDEDCPMEETEADSKVDTTLVSGLEVFQADVTRSNTTHRSHAFLFDTEFQVFLKGLLDHALTSSDLVTNDEHMVVLNQSSAQEKELQSQNVGDNWCVALIKLSLSFYFNVLLHSVDKDTLDEWTQKLVAVLHSSKEGSKFLLHKIAKGTRTVNENWLRVYTSDCPEDLSRAAAVRVFVAAFQTCISFTDEVVALEAWTQAWSEQLAVFDKLANERGEQTTIPTSLGPDWQHYEDVSRIDEGKASSLGIVISYLSTLLEVAPRTWRYNADLCTLLKELGSSPDNKRGDCLRAALIQAQVPARLICLMIREKAPLFLRTSMPGSSLSQDIAEAMTRPETSLSSHLLPLAGGSVGIGPSVSSNNNNSSIPAPSDHMNSLEALASILGIGGVKSAPLTFETGDFVKGRPIVDLTNAAQDALTVVFNECAPNSGEMEQRDIMNYLKLCGLSVPQQRIINILNKYGKGSKFLTLEGFLLYYRDTSQSNEMQVRSDLRSFGFRPDLTRCSNAARFYASGERQVPFEKTESVAIDISEMQRKKKRMKIGRAAEVGLASFELYLVGHSTSSHVAEYILAWATLEKDTSRLLSESLKSLYRAQPSWAGTEIAQACIMIFKVLAALPDEKQKERITTLMQSLEKVHVHSEGGSGLLVVAKELSLTRSSQHYNSDYHHSSNLFERYIDALKDLQKLRGVSNWMSENRSVWSWIEQWLRSDMVQVSHHQIRGDYLSRGDGQVHLSDALDHQNQSDSDANIGGNDSDDDDDSRFETGESYSTTGKIAVSGAGLDAINGIYNYSGVFDNVARYSKIGIWQDHEETFSLFRCRLSDHTKRWYISIVPKNIQPGTNKDTDFYLAAATGDQSELPDNHNWVTAKENGIDPPPTVTFKCDPISDSGEDPIDQGGRLSGEDHHNTETVEDDEHMCYL